MLILSEDDVKRVLTLNDAVAAVEQGLKDRARTRAVDTARVRTPTAHGSLNVLPGAAPEIGVVGYKVNYSGAHGSCSHIYLYSHDTGELLARVEGNFFFNDLRTAAATGVGTKYLARNDAGVLGQIGAGRQGVGQLEAVCAVRSIRRARIFARTRDKLVTFCQKMSAKLGLDVIPATTPQAAVAGADIVNVITKSSTPVLMGEWLEPGMHINAAGANLITRRELDLAATRRCDLIVVDSRDTARRECGDLLPLVKAGGADWDALPDIGEIAAGVRPGRSAHGEITLFESHGMAIEDLYVAALVLKRARALNLGTKV